MSALSSAAVTIEDGEITIAADLLRVPPPPAMNARCRPRRHRAKWADLGHTAQGTKPTRRARARFRLGAL